MDDAISALTTAGRKDVADALVDYEAALDASDLPAVRREQARQALWRLAAGSAKPYSDPSLGMKFTALRIASALEPELEALADRLGKTLGQ